MITELNVHQIGLGFRNCVVAEIRTDDGFVGIGETVLKRHSKTLEASIRELGRYLVGKDPNRIEDHHEKMYRDSFWVGGPLHASAISAVDIALWDILGQRLGVPIYQLLGGPARDAIPVYCHCAAGDEPEEFAANLIACQQRGFFAAKTTLPVFYGSGKSDTGYSGLRGAIEASRKETEYIPTSAIDKIAKFFQAGREAVGPDFELAVDCHGRLSVANAIRLCDALEPFGLMFIEEPVPPESVEAVAEVTRRSSTPIASGERWTTVYGAQPFLEQRAVSILQPDIVNCGGITSGKKIAALAQSKYIPLCPHNPNGPLATAASLHILASIPNCFMLESIGSQLDHELHGQMVDHPLIPVDGYIQLPTEPGIGMKLLPDAAERFPYQVFKGWR